MNVIGIIPARYASSRFEGKVLAPLDGKPMIQHVWERARRARLLERIIIACDDERILKAAQAFGAEAQLTSTKHASGTDRLTEIVNPLDMKIVVNIQADEPLVHPSMIDDVADALLSDPSAVMATVKKRIEDEAELASPNVVKVVSDKHGFALYFSRAPIPFRRDGRAQAATKASTRRAARIQPVHYKHIGLYAYTKDFLFHFLHLPPSSLEQTEQLEQLRVLEHGYRIKVIETTHETIGVDTPQDLERVAARLQQGGPKG